MYAKSCFFLLFFSLLVNAESNCKLDCVYENSWAIGLAVGTGSFSNPLHDGKDIKINLLPSFYYYGKRFYIENTEMGYLLTEHNNWLIKLTGKLNNDGIYFNKTSFDNFIVSGLATPGNFTEADGFVSANDISRKYSYMAGLTADYFIRDNLMFSLGAFYDITNVHHGYSIKASLQYSWKIKKWQIQTSISSEYKSSNLVNYYYGLRPEDGTAYANFSVTDNTNIAASLSLSYRLNNTFSIQSHYQYQRLGDSITSSPLVDLHYQQFFFLGVSAQYGSH